MRPSPTTKSGTLTVFSSVTTEVGDSCYGISGAGRQFGRRLGSGAEMEPRRAGNPGEVGDPAIRPGDGVHALERIGWGWAMEGSRQKDISSLPTGHVPLL